MRITFVYGTIGDLRRRLGEGEESRTPLAVQIYKAHLSVHSFAEALNLSTWPSCARLVR
ncbi:MAG: hypothetical protein II355_00950 [Bacteroidales bacterium]|nr:hypothetical protein [Bacteroidales bacterium]